MIVYKVERTKELENYSESLFIETLAGIYAETPTIGFFKHPTITNHEMLMNHLQQMKKEGFKIRKTTHTIKI